MEGVSASKRVTQCSRSVSSTVWQGRSKWRPWRCFRPTPRWWRPSQPRVLLAAGPPSRVGLVLEPGAARMPRACPDLVPAGPGAQPCQALCWRRLGSPHGLGGGPVRKAEADEPQGPLHSGSLCRALPARSWLQGSGRPQTTAEAGISRSSLPHRVLVGLKAIPTAAPLAGALFPAIPHRQHTVQCGHQHHGKAPAPQPRHPDPHA